MVQAPIEGAFELILDPQLYPKADAKITAMKVVQQGGQGTRVRMRFFVLLPVFESSVTLRVTTQPYSLIEFE